MKTNRLAPLAAAIGLLSASFRVSGQTQSTPAILAPPSSTGSVGAMPSGGSVEIAGGGESTEAAFAPSLGRSRIVEWVDMLWSYDQQMDRLARELGRKYRPLLMLPDDGSYVPAEDLLGAGATVHLRDAHGQRSLLSVTVSNAPCLDAARQEYTALKAQYEKALLQAFGNWLGVVNSARAEGAVAAWEAVEDLRSMRRGLFGSAHAGERELGPWEMLAKATARQISDGAKDTVIYLLKLGPTRHVPDVVQDYLFTKGMSATGFEETMGDTFSEMMGHPTPEAMDKAIAVVTALGDVALDLAAYPPGERGGKPAPDYYGLGGRAYVTTNLVFKRELPPVKEEVTGGYLNTGFAFKWNHRRILAREFGLQNTAYREKVDPWKSINRGTISLEARDMAELLAGRSVEKPLEEDAARRTHVTVRSENVYDWYELEKRYKNLDSEYRKLGEDGELLWFERLKSPDPAKVASAVRLLQMDLQRISQESDEEVAANEIWKFVLGEVKDLCAKAPAYLNPLSAVADAYLEKLIKYQSRDLRAEFAKDLNAAVMRAIRQIAKPPDIPMVFKEGRSGIEKAITPGTNTPLPCMAATGPRWKLVKVYADANNDSSTNDIMWDGAKLGQWVRTVRANHWRYVWDQKSSSGSPNDFDMEVTFDPPPQELIGGTSFELKVRATARSVARRKKLMAGGFYWCDDLKVEPNYSYGPDRDLMDREYVGATPAGFVESKETTYRFTVPLKPKSVYSTTMSFYEGIIGDTGQTCFTYEKVSP